MTILRCNRCSCPVEEPIVYADELCDACMHVPLCTACTDWHRAEFDDGGDQLMDGIIPGYVIDRIRAMQARVYDERGEWGNDPFHIGWLGGVEDVIGILFDVNRQPCVAEPEEGESR